jgi:hypothetical protein
MAGLNKRTDEYRRLARECLRVSKTILTEEAKLALIEMARVWTRLADEQDAALLPRSEHSQPVMQQQQQMQPKKDRE